MKNNIITTSKKSKKILLIAGIVAIVGLIFLGLMYFMYLRSRYGYGITMNYILYRIIKDFDDIVETLFELSLTVAVIVFLVVFFKKIWHKL